MSVPAGEVTPLSFEEARTELALLATAYREGTMDLDEWCIAVHETIRGYEAGAALRHEQGARE